MIRSYTSANIATTYLAQKREGDTNAQELAKMLQRELAQDLEEGFFDLLGVDFWVVGFVRQDQASKIGAVDRIVDGDGDLKLGTIVDGGSRHASPHWLHYKKVNTLQTGAMEHIR